MVIAVEYALERIGRIILTNRCPDVFWRCLQFKVVVQNLVVQENIVGQFVISVFGQ